MIYGVHIEVVLAGGYALFLVSVAFVLEYLASDLTGARNIIATPVSSINGNLTSGIF